MPARPPQTQESGRSVDMRSCYVAGGAAGVLSSPAGAFQVGDEIQSVARFTTATFVPGTDLTQEFVTAMGGTGTVSVADQISNAAGSSTVGQLLFVTYYRRNARL